jgi:hypothetical protein
MKHPYLALGINPDNTILVLKPIAAGRNIDATEVFLADLNDKGHPEAPSLVGQMLLHFLSAFHAERFAGYDLLTPLPRVSPFPNRPSQEHNGKMGGAHLAIGLLDDDNDALVFKTCHNERHHSPPVPFAFRNLERLGVVDQVSRFIGEVAMSSLAAVHAPTFAQYRGLRKE